MNQNIRNYCISNPESLRKLPELEQAQFTLNSRMYPAKRVNTVEGLRLMKPQHNTQLVIHYDYVYIISRYIFLQKEVQQDIIREISTLMDYAETEGDEIIGLIMHTDFPLRKQIYQNKNLSPSFIEGVYNGPLWNKERIVKFYEHFVKSDNLGMILEYSFDKFYEDMKITREGKTIPFKVYLENTTKVPVSGYSRLQPGTIEFINDYLRRNASKQDLFGMCLDTEHDYAVKGPYNTRLDWDCDILIHLNPVPKGVLPGSLKDQHSHTTLFECSVNSYEFYLDLISKIRERNIPFIRECYLETMEREQKQIEDYEHKVLRK